MCLEEELQDLWIKSVLKHRKLKLSTSKKKQTKAGIQKHYFKPFFESGGSISLKRSKSATLEAAVLFYPNRKQQLQQFVVLSEPGHKNSLNWAESVIDSNLHQYDGKCFVQLQPWQSGLLEVFSRYGVRPRSVKLEGEVSSSLKKMRAHYGRSLRSPFVEEGLVLVPAKTKAEVETYLKILRSEYRKNPQFGTFVSSKEFLDFVRKDLLAAIKNKKKPLWLVKKAERIIGGVDILETGPALDGRQRASFGVNLIGAFQGKGFARAIYESILIELQSRGIALYIGNTAQPGVMKLGHILGRKLQGIEADRGVAPQFPRGHFKPWLGNF